MLTVLLIKPSRYDDDGYVVHHQLGVLPSNTLNCLNGLLRKATEDMGVEAAIYLFDETVGLVEPEKLLKKTARPGIPTLVCLAGVQTNQFPRAADLAVRFRKAGAMVSIGGFHVSGSMALLGMTPELQALVDQGISLFNGEAEGRLEEVVSDALKGELKPVYESCSLPSLEKGWAMPLVDKSLAQRFVLPDTGTLDTSRGCIFKCSFCTIINVQGNSMRFRSPELLEKHIRAHYPEVRHYFFTDDNLARNPHWKDIFVSMKKLRGEGIMVSFMMQVDVPSYRIPEFADMAAEAGCSQVFIGLESLNATNLAAASKRQNKVDRYDEMMEAWHRHGIAVHTSYIIGFPDDSIESVRQDIQTLINVVRPDQASFFMLTPLPGSVDHLEKKRKGEWMSDDFNEYDSFHAAAHHEKMTDREWFDIYREAWKTFYSPENLINILNRATPVAYWGIFKNAVWYAYAALCEEAHPMITGLWRLKGRAERRPTFPMEGRLAYAWRRVKDSTVLSARLVKLVLMFERIWRATWLSRRARGLGDSLSAVKSQQAQRGRQLLARRVAWFTRCSLSLGQSRAVWGRFWKELRQGKVWHPRLYLDGIHGSIVTGLELVTLGWLFLMNFALET
ncbi:MAG: radical SAM protein [Armatimonadetes bacterium]|nr:radical SAM protein [Armatimonadota bacterium]